MVHGKEKAILCDFGDGVDDESEIWHKGDEGTLIVSEWIAEQKKLR